MQDTELETSIYRLTAQIAASRVFAAGLRLQLAFKQNPNWHIQPRVPAGDPDGGQWLAYLVGAAGSLLPVLQRVGLAALQRLRTEARRLGPVLRRLPRRWDDSLQPSEDSYDDETDVSATIHGNDAASPTYASAMKTSCEDISALPALAANGITSSKSGSPVEKVSRQKKYIAPTISLACLSKFTGA